MPNFIKICQTVAEIWRFNVFKMATSAMLDFGNSNFLTAKTVKRPILHNHAKCRKDRSNCYIDIAIFEIVKMAAAAIFVFEKFEILAVCPPYWANVRHLAKFHQSRSNGCVDMAI